MKDPTGLAGIPAMVVSFVRRYPAARPSDVIKDMKRHPEREVQRAIWWLVEHEFLRQDANGRLHAKPKE